MAYLRLPDNSFFTIPEGKSPQEAYALARQKYPEAFEPPKPKDTGFTGALKAGVEDLKGDAALLAGRTGLMDEAKAEAYAKAQKKKAQDIFAPTEEGWADAPFLKARELLGGSLPYVVAPVVAAGAAKVAAPAAGLAALGAGFGAGATQYTATNLGRQVDEGTALKDTDLLAAGAAAIPQAALDTLSLRLIPGVGRIFGAAGKKITPEMAKEIAQQGIRKTAGAYALQGAKTAGIEGSTEVAQQFLERLQAGLDIADPEARDEYFESFIGGAVLGGTLSVPGKFMERGGAKQLARAEEQRLQDEADAKAEQERQAALEAKDVAALVAQQQKTGDMFGDVAGKARVLPETFTKTGERLRTADERLDDTDTSKVPEFVATGTPTTSVRERERAAQEAGVEMPTYAEVTRTKAQLETLAKQTQVKLEAAIASGNTEAYREIAPQLENIRLALDATDKQLAALPQPEKAPEIVRAELERDLLKAQNEFKKYTGEAFDKQKLDAVATKIDGIQAKLAQLAPAGKESGRQADFFGEMEAQDREVLNEQAIKQAQELTTPTPKAEPATQEDIAAYKESVAKVQQLQSERDRLQDLFDTANSNNDIRGAVDLQKLIARKDAEIAEAKGQKPATKVKQAPLLEEIDAVKEGREIQSLRDQVKKLDDRLKAAAGSRTALEKDGALTPAGEKLAAAQVERDEKIAEIARRQDILDQYNAAQGAETSTTEAIAQAFPTVAGKAGPDVDVIGSMAALRQQVGTGVGLRGQLMGLRRQLQNARAKRNKEGRGIDRQEISKIINEMRSVTERLQDQDKVSADLPIPEKLPERTKKYYKALNEARAKQRKALANYMDALEALYNRDYIGGVTKKAKVTKQIVEKRVEDAEIAFADSMLAEVAIHRRVTGALPLVEKREEAFRNQYMAALKDVRKLAEGTLAAPESARAVIAEQIADITYAATQERGAKTRVEPLLKTQFASAEQETTADRVAALEERLKTADPLVAKGIKAELARIKEETPDVSNVGAVEQRDLFGAKDLEPTATTRATHKNFMRFLGIQSSKFRSSLREAQAAITKAKGPMASLPERIRAYRVRVGAYAKVVQEVLDNVSAEARAAAKAEVKSRANALRKEALAITETLYGPQIADLEKRLKTVEVDYKFFKRNIGKMSEGPAQKVANRKLTELENEIKKINNQLNSIYESFETALDSAPIKEENRLFAQYVSADPVLASVKATMERKRATLDKMLTEHDNNLETDAAKRRAAEPKEEIREVTPEERQQEQRMLEGLGLPGIKLIEGELTPVLSTTQKAKAAEEAISAEARRSSAYSKERAALKKRQAELRAAEAKERKGYEKDINALRDEYEALDPVKDADKRLAILKKAEPLFKKYRALTPIERIAADEKSKRARGPATKDVTPPQFKTGVKASPKTRVEAQNKFEAEIAEGLAAERDFDYSDTGLSAAGFDDIVSQINEAKYRAENIVGGTGLSGAKARSFIDGIKVPKGLKIVVLDKLNFGLAARIRAQGINPDTVRGGVLPDGSVFIVASNHTDVKDLQRTLAHEITGHLGVENLLGEAGMNALIRKITSQYGSVFKLADALGVGQDALAAFNAAKRIGKTDQQALASAVREMIAHTEEARPDKNFLAKASEFIKAMVGAVRAALRKIGIDLDISTSDIFKLLRDARKDFDATAPGAYVNKDGDILFSSKPSTATGEFANVLRTAGKIVAEQKPWHDRLFGELTGLVFQTKYLDRFAPVQKVLEKTRNSLKATQLMYFLRMHDQRMAWTSEIASHGAAVLRAAKDGKGLIVESQDGANLKQIAEALKDARVGTPEDTNRMFTLYLLAKRAKRVGIDKLNFSGKVTESMLKDAMRAVENSKETKDAFEKAAGIYNEYNKGLVNFAIQTGAISKEIGRLMLASEDYVPFYREKADGTIVLEIGGAAPIKIGNVAEQPYLHELIGGDEAILDFFTSSLQNTAMMTDMALRNLAARNTAFTLGEMGLLKVGEKEKGIGIRPGDGPSNKPGAHKTIRFKVDGEEKHVIVNTDAAGVDSELLVRGLEGVNTALPNAVKMMNIPANLLRKWVTRNPAYALRQVIRDPMNAVMVSGVNTIPVISSLREIGKVIPKILKGEEVQSELRSKGILGGQVLTGTAEDQKQILTQITSGKAGWDSVWARADQLAIQGDAATRVVMYNSFIKQGLSEMEATLATLEAMNFSKRGISPSLFALSTMVPFMNAQIQGLNVLYNAFAGKMPFSDKLRIKQKLFQRAAMMTGFTLLYAAMMQDDEAYKNANDEEKLNNWFIYVPGVDEPVRVPIPFELGLLFKALPEAIVNTAFGDDKARDTMSAIGKLAWNAVPISGPQGVKPLLETAINHSFYTGREIESDRLQRFEPGERYNDRTTELVKAIGQATNISPVKIEYLIRGYFGGIPLAIGSLANPVLRSGESGEKPEGRASELPLFGSFFQPTDAQGLVNKAYKDVESINRTKETWKKMEEEGRYKEADALLDAEADLIGLASMAGRFRKEMGDLTKQEREIKADPTLSAQEKRKALDEIRQDKIQLAKDLSSERG